MILVVDDLRIFPDTIGDSIVHHALNSKDAITFLEANFPMISEIWLDHDLSIIDDKADEITPVLYWLEEKAYNGEANHINCIRVLTNNPVGAQKIAALGRYFYIAPTPKHIGIREVKDCQQ